MASGDTGGWRSIRLSKLPRDVSQAEVEEAAAYFRVRSVDIYETKSNKATSHALVVVGWDNVQGNELVRGLRERIQRGAIFRGKTDVVINVLPARNGRPARNTPTPSDDTIVRRFSNWEMAKELATDFHAYINSDPNLMSQASDREEVGRIFTAWVNTQDLPLGSPKTKTLCSFVMAALRRKRLMRSNRIGDVVITVFAGPGGAGDFPPMEDRNAAKKRVLERRQNLQEDKEGVELSHPTVNDGVMVLPGQSLDITFDVTSTSSVTLKRITIQGPNLRSFESSVHQPQQIKKGGTATFNVTFNSIGIGVYRGTVSFHFRKGSKDFTIARYLTVRSGDSVMHDALKPTSPYQKKMHRKERKGETPIVLAPKGSGQGGASIYDKLRHHRVPLEVKEMVENKELESNLTKPEDDFREYVDFWRKMVWAQEVQARIDITLYDMEKVSLIREGRLYKLSVPGLAESRPSVLRGDIVNITCRNRRFQGRVVSIRLLEVLLDFDPSFQQHHVANVDRVDVRFTFSRTTFRTSHEGILLAPETMGKGMLLPEPTSFDCPARTVRNIHWANQNLNHEQKLAVENVLWGKARPLPYIIFGPPGTGKTTTVVEVIYQLARLSNDLKILLIAPSNDAADILVSRLATYFPPSDLRRILAYSRSMDQVAKDVKPFCREGLSDEEKRTDIMSAKIVVGTVNLSARLSLLGIPRGHFNVLCVDEAGHATEPEVVSVAATLLDFQGSGAKERGQLILAGDPRQLGPIITSDICKKYGMSISYMERLAGRDVYGRASVEKGYPPELLTKLVRNYRSHPSIMKLPNELFYDDELIMCGDKLSTHSLARWEHLPQTGFPIIFHAVHGENLREGSSPSWFNPQEAQQVTDYVQLLVQQTRPAVSPDDIGIITPYARQAQKITTALRISNLDGIKVGSVETFQGQERRVVILSTVRAENDLLTSDKKYNLGFVANEKRFNVAVTRAKALLIIIGHPKVLATDKKCWLPLMKFCKEKQSWLGQDWEEDESSSEDESDESDSDDEGFVRVSHAVEQEGMGYINREE